LNSKRISALPDLRTGKWGTYEGPTSKRFFSKRGCKVQLTKTEGGEGARWGERLSGGLMKFEPHQSEKGKF